MTLLIRNLHFAILKSSYNFMAKRAHEERDNKFLF